MTETAPIHWSAIEPGADDEGCSVVRTRDQMVTHFAAMALAQSVAFREYAVLADPCTKEGMLAAVDHHMGPAIAAFTAAAALSGWDIDEIEGIVQDAQSMDEWCCQWLSDAGLGGETIRRLTADLNAPDVVTSLGA